MLLRREKALDTVQRLVGIVGVQRAEAQMTGFRKGQGLHHSLGGTHLSNHNHVGRLSQGILQGDIEGLGIHAHFPLGDNTVAVVMHVFDRVFNGNNVAAAIMISIAHHRRQRSRLTRTGRTHKNDQTALGH